jgi:hypothetical protein
MSVIKASNIQNGSSASVNIALNTDGSATFAQMPVPPSPYAMRNKIINGAMVIDQRNAGAAVTTGGAFPVDRFQIGFSTDGAYSAQRSTNAPSGFSNSMLFTTTTADASLSASQYAAILQNIEGFNTADFAWGTASAKAVTFSFWVQSSLTGTFGGSVRNGSFNRSYPFTYSISVANTWEYKTVTIPGDITGTWATDNGTGVTVFFGLGAGSSVSGTAGVWASANYLSATGTVSVIGTLNATFYVTGVQLEVGSVATPFERRLYNQELAMCQRYYEVDDIPASGSPKISSSGLAQGTTHYLAMFKVSKRATPTVAMTYISNIDNSTSSVGTTSISSGAFRGFNTISNGSFYYADAWVRYAASAEL